MGFWFDCLTPEQHFTKKASLDREIAERFGSLRDAVLAGGAAEWRETPETLMAAVILLDQFSRNIHRDTARAFEADPLARALTLEAIDKGWDTGMSGDWQTFLYMPLMHAEDRELQTLSLEKFAQLGREQQIEYARQHAEVIAQFGRFPSRNEALGRESTDAEKLYLSQPNAGW